MQENRDNKPWEGQLYLCHSSAIVCKLLYKKFFRKTDTTVIYGQWKQVLLQQQRIYDANGKETLQGDEDESLDMITSPMVRTPSGPQVPITTNNTGVPAMEPSFFLPLSPLPTSPTIPMIASYSSLPTLYERRQKKSILNTSIQERSKLIATSKHGMVSAGEIEPIECLVLFYTSSWAIPKAESNALNRIFGPTLVPKIETYIREEFNGEQIPGTSFVLETGSQPCKYIVCTSVSKDPTLLSVDYAYNSFRASLLAIYNYNRQHLDKQITSILCPALESLTLPPYNLVHQMAVCYEYWDWHVYAHGTVLPFTHKDEEHICKQMRTTSPALQRISADLEQFIKLGLIVHRGLVYDMELQVLLGWLVDNPDKPKPIRKDVPLNQIPVKTDLSKAVLAQALVDVLKKPDAPPFTLTPMQICVGLTGDALDCVLQLAKENKIKIFDEIDPKQLVYGDVLAHGTSGSVSKAMWNEVPVAVKIFFSYQPQLFFNELTMITLVRHPKLVEAIGGYYDKNNAIIVTELLDTNLCQYLQVKKDLTPRIKLKIASDIAEAMHFLHSRNIVHRDLKSVNVLLNCGLDIVAKVCDFGLSRVADSTSTMTGNIGTVSWIAPEIFENKRYTEKCDVYSFGIILYEIMTESLPYKELPTFKIPMVVVKGTRPTLTPETCALMPKEFIDLMKLCWHENPSKRPSFATVIEKLAGMYSAPAPKPVSTAATDSDEESTSSDNMSTSSGNLTSTAIDTENACLEELKLHYKRARPVLITDDLMRKCLRVRHYKVPAAKQVIRSYLEWYQLFNQGKLLKVSDVRGILESKILYFVEGVTDLEGRALMMLDFTTWDTVRPSEPDVIRALMYVVERASATPESQTKGIVLTALLNNFNSSSVSFRLVNAIFAIIRKCYPLNLKRMLCVNPPPSFSRFLTMYQVFIKTTMKIIETMPQDKLPLYIDPESTLTELGGKLNYDVGKWIRSRYEAEGLEYI